MGQVSAMVPLAQALQGWGTWISSLDTRREEFYVNQ